MLPRLGIGTRCNATKCKDRLGSYPCIPLRSVPMKSHEFKNIFITQARCNAMHAPLCHIVYWLVHVLYVGGSELHKLNEGVVRPFFLDNKSNLEREITD